MTIRTMVSDLASLTTSGGIGVTPQAFSPSFETETPAEESSSFVVPGYSGPEKAIFEPKNIPLAREIEAESGKSQTVKLIFMIGGGIVLIALFWLLGYYVIFPWLFPLKMPPVQ